MCAQQTDIRNTMAASSSSSSSSGFRCPQPEAPSARDVLVAPRPAKKPRKGKGFSRCSLHGPFTRHTKRVEGELVQDGLQTFESECAKAAENLFSVARNGAAQLINEVFTKIMIASPMNTEPYFKAIGFPDVDAVRIWLQTAEIEPTSPYDWTRNQSGPNSLRRRVEL